MLRARRSLRVIALVAIGVSACGDTPGGGDAGPQVDGDVTDLDASIATTGLVLEFFAVPSIPSSASGPWSAEISLARFQLEDVRAIGDSAPGDYRTTIDTVRLGWVEVASERVRFSKAPPGVYSRALGDIDSFRVEGTVVVDGQRMPFVLINADVDENFTADLHGVTLNAGETATAPIDVRIEKLIEEVPWDEVDENAAGVLEIDRDHPLMPDVTHELHDMFDNDDDD